MKLLLLFFLQITSPLEKLQRLIDSLQHEEEVKSGIVAASIRSTQTGEYKLQYNNEKSVNSASTLKLVSTSAALSILGANYSYQTFLEYDGEICDSILTGNLYIRGTGDPSLGTSRSGLDFQHLLSCFAKKIKDFGIKQIDGYVLGDGSIFPDKNLADTWIWGDIGNYYGAGVSGLNVHENFYQVIFKPGRTAGELAPVVRFQPEIPEMYYDNKVLTGEKNSGDRVNIYCTPLGQTILMDGTVPAHEEEFSVKGSLPDPPFFLAFHLKKKLEECGIKVTSPLLSFNQYLRENNEKTARNLIYAHQSPTLAELTRLCNYESLNLYADAFLKMIGYSLTKDASFSASIKALKQFWEQKSIDLQGFMIKDGSGLSPSGVLTARNLTDILYVMKQDVTFPDFYNSIPVVGISGTVQNLCKGSDAVGNVRAKSGSIQNTRAYAGYFTSANGDLMSFALIVNRYSDGADRKVKRFLEEIMKIMIEI